MPDLHAGGNGSRKFTVHHTSLGGFHGYWHCTTVVIWYIRFEHALHGHEYIGIGKIEHNIAAPIYLWRRSIKVHGNTVPYYLDRYLDNDIALTLHLFHDTFCTINAVR